ncbi:hypothetical protein [Embleya sp. NPDC005971]|uniref:hypothetical protein n=1 Tax=Embleya sp. NPDC005971 TaxID=3156724 RepID=UPI0033C87720
MTTDVTIESDGNLHHVFTHGDLASAAQWIGQPPPTGDGGGNGEPGLGVQESGIA